MFDNRVEREREALDIVAAAPPFQQLLHAPAVNLGGFLNPNVGDDATRRRDGLQLLDVIQSNEYRLIAVLAGDKHVGLVHVQKVRRPTR